MFILELNQLFTFLFFFFNDTATTEIYTLSLHDALPISHGAHGADVVRVLVQGGANVNAQERLKHCTDRKSTRLNSSHGYISYAVFCLKKKKKHPEIIASVVSYTSQCTLLIYLFN